ncbi:GMP/IMP nucleotidase [Thalassotalea sp. G2M2-11]|uniref:GMP/IMP nucleotidase n=1 Tax=Thalassotalea sp. G2M2-11 TaxID=2787627 RepID=UPI0019D20786|nr:GMP/IMP nucleotidase [Thalassotalea sp. G2M2-11]
MLDWSNISTVLLDMDGTILDLYFDNHFWLEHLPKRYSESENISLSEAKKYMAAQYQEVYGTIGWYCLDYWAEQTQLPIAMLKREVQHLIRLRDDAEQFLLTLKATGRRVILVTNAHPDSLSLKVERTQLDKYFDKLYSTHEFGVTKESQELWQKLKKTEPFDLSSTLFVDDNIDILDSAKEFGIQHLLAVANPDSQQPAREITQYPSVQDFNTLVDDISNNPYSG